MVTSIDLLQILSKLITSIDGRIQKWNFAKRSCDKCEINLGSFFLNPQSRSIGVYYDSSKKDFTFWVGYWEKYGFCVSFHSNHDPYVEQFLKNLKLDYHADYIKIDKQKYWYSIVFNNQEDDNVISEAEEIVRKVLKEAREIL